MCVSHNPISGPCVGAYEARHKERARSTRVCTNMICVYYKYQIQIPGTLIDRRVVILANQLGLSLGYYRISSAASSTHVQRWSFFVVVVVVVVVVAGVGFSLSFIHSIGPIHPHSEQFLRMNFRPHFTELVCLRCVQPVRALVKTCPNEIIRPLCINKIALVGPRYFRGFWAAKSLCRKTSALFGWPFMDRLTYFTLKSILMEWLVTGPCDAMVRRIYEYNTYAIGKG